jgi:hypothetical protein
MGWLRWLLRRWRTRHDVYVSAQWIYEARQNARDVK